MPAAIAQSQYVRAAEHVCNVFGLGLLSVANGYVSLE